MWLAHRTHKRILQVSLARIATVVVAPHFFLTKAGWTSFSPTARNENPRQRRDLNPGPLGREPGALTTRPPGRTEYKMCHNNLLFIEYL